MIGKGITRVNSILFAGLKAAMHFFRAAIIKERVGLKCPSNRKVGQKKIRNEDTYSDILQKSFNETQ